MIIDKPCLGFLALAVWLGVAAAHSSELFESPFIDCPQPCTCFSTSNGDIQVNCEAPSFRPSSGDQLLDFHMLPHNATKISVYRGTGLQVLPGRSFTPFRALSTLEIRLSDLQDLDEMSFAGLRTLRVLNLQLNAIKTLSRNVFRQTVWLTELRLDENVIDDLPDGIFDQLRTLRILDLSKNRLVNIRPAMFAGLNLLQELRLTRNRIVELDMPVFSGMINLQHLDLSGNQLKRISGPAFANMSTINHLDLSSNQLSFVDPTVFSGIETTVQKLYLCDNPWICDCPLVALKRWIDFVKQPTSTVARTNGVVFDKPPKTNDQLVCRTTCRLPSLISGASLVNMREASVYCPTTTTTTTPETTLPPVVTSTDAAAAVTTQVSSTSLSSLMLLAPPARSLDIGNLSESQAVVNESGSTSFDMTISIAIAVAVAGVLFLIIVVSLIVYQVKKCQARRRRYKRHPSVAVGAGSALGSSTVLVANNKQQTLFPAGGIYGAPYGADITSGGGSTGSDMVSDSKSDSSAGSPNGMNCGYQTSGRVAGIFGIPYGEQWPSPNSAYYGVSSTSSTTVLGYPPSLSLNPMPTNLPGLSTSSVDPSQAYPTSLSLHFQGNSTSTPAKPFSFIGNGSSSHVIPDIMTASFPPPPPQSAIAILDMHNDNIVGHSVKNSLTSSRSESLV